MYKFASTFFISIILSACINYGSSSPPSATPNPETLTSAGDAYKGPVLVLDDVEIIYIPDPGEEFNNEDTPDVADSETTTNSELTELPLQQ